MSYNQLSGESIPFVVGSYGVCTCSESPGLRSVREERTGPRAGSATVLVDILFFLTILVDTLATTSRASSALSNG